MSISLTPDTYTPSMDDNGNYVDSVPTIKNGLYCLCGSRRDKIYENTSKFSAHIHTKTHQKWITILNQNKANYYVEVMKYKELTENQQKIITRLENQLHTKALTIDYLTEQLLHNKQKNMVVADLLDIDIH